MPPVAFPTTQQVSLGEMYPTVASGPWETPCEENGSTTVSHPGAGQEWVRTGGGQDRLSVNPGVDCTLALKA